MRVRVNSSYIFHPTLMDACDPKTDLKSGDKVTVKNLFGCPKANTMGHCYVFVGDVFKGMVCCNSLHTEKDWKEYLKTQELVKA